MFLKIGEIETQKEQFEADVFIQIRWREPRLDDVPCEVCRQLHLSISSGQSVLLSLCPSVPLSFCQHLMRGLSSVTSLHLLRPVCPSVPLSLRPSILLSVYMRTYMHAYVSYEICRQIHLRISLSRSLRMSLRPSALLQTYPTRFALRRQKYISCI